MRRIRFRSGLLMLLAMTFSFVEGVQAATCDPGMEAASPVASAEQAMPDMLDMPGMPAHADCPPAHRGAGDHPSGDGGPCPFGLPGLSQGCTAAASLPATSTAEIVPSPEGAALTAVTETEPDLLLGSALFHPPKP